MKVDFHKKFLKKFKKLPISIRSRFVERKNLFIESPNHPILYNHSVDRAYPGCRSINVTGNYRAIFRPLKDGVIFIAIGTHPELYG